MRRESKGKKKSKGLDEETSDIIDKVFFLEVSEEGWTLSTLQNKRTLKEIYHEKYGVPLDSYSVIGIERAFNWIRNEFPKTWKPKEISLEGYNLTVEVSQYCYIITATFKINSSRGEKKQ